MSEPTPYRRLLVLCALVLAGTLAVHLPVEWVGGIGVARTLPLLAMVLLLSLLLLGVYVLHEPRRDRRGWGALTALAFLHLLAIMVFWRDPAVVRFHRAAGHAAEEGWADALEPIDRAGAYGFTNWEAYALYNQLAREIYQHTDRDRDALDAAARYKKVVDKHGYATDWVQSFLLAGTLAPVARRTADEHYLRGFLSELNELTTRARAAGVDDDTRRAFASHLLSLLGPEGQQEVRRIAEELSARGEDTAAIYAPLLPLVKVPAEPMPGATAEVVDKALARQLREIEQQGERRQP